MKLNKQPIEKRDLRTDDTLDVHSIFYTIQGEGPFCGTPCVFIRLAGCNLQCPACDTEYTAGRKRMEVIDLVNKVCDLHEAPRGQQRRLVVITGGEPFRQNLTPLFRQLERCGFYMQVESNGTLEPSDWAYTRDISIRHGVYIVCSPKSGKVHPDIWAEACCAKYVMKAGNMREEDGLPMTALLHPANPYLARPPGGWNRPIYLQPMDAKNRIENERNIAAVRDSCLKHGHILQLQIHKYIGVE